MRLVIAKRCHGRYLVSISARLHHDPCLHTLVEELLAVLKNGWNNPVIVVRVNVHRLINQIRHILNKTIQLKLPRRLHERISILTTPGRLLLPVHVQVTVVLRIYFVALGLKILVGIVIGGIYAKRPSGKQADSLDVVGEC